MLRRCLLVALVLVAGCSEAPAPAAGPAPVDAALHPYVFECLPGSANDPDTGVCSTAYAEPGHIFFMQRLRASPTQPDVVVGAGIEAARSLYPGLPRAEPTNPGLDLQRPVVHVSEDGGATWTKRQVPSIHVDGVMVPVDYAAQSLTADVAIDAQGVVHLAVTVQPQVLTWMQGDPPTEAYTRQFLYHIQSPDLGRTWSEPVFLGVEDPSWYPRIEVLPDGQLAILWSDGALNATLSADGGETWRLATVVPSGNATLDEEVPESPTCTWVGFPAAWQGSLFVPCWSGPESGEAGQLRMARLDADGTLRALDDERTAEDPGASCETFRLASSSHGLAIVGSGCPEIYAATSLDGVTWTAQDLAGLLTVDDGSTTWYASSLAAAPDGSLHLQMSDFTSDDPGGRPDPTGLDPLVTAMMPGNLRSVYASLTPGFGGVLSEVVLQADQDACAVHATSSVGVNAAIVFWDEKGLLSYGCGSAMLSVGLRPPA